MGAMPRSYQVTSAGPSHLVPTKRMHANPRAATTLRARHQVIRIQPPQYARQPHPDTDVHATEARSGAVLSVAADTVTAP